MDQVKKDLDFPFKPIKINCQTCKGEKNIVSPEKAPAKLKEAYPKHHLLYKDVIRCPDCEGKGYTEVKNL